jgi:hypothetical protein
LLQRARLCRQVEASGFNGGRILPQDCRESCHRLRLWRRSGCRRDGWTRSQAGDRHRYPGGGSPSRKPAGEVLVSFGPTWRHPLGGHLFSVFPWAHLMFSEQALIRWRSTFKTDGATRFSEVAGGLNRMTIAKFERLIADSPLQFASLELVPIKKLRPFHNRVTREFTTAVVRCRLIKRT